MWRDTRTQAWLHVVGDREFGRQQAPTHGLHRGHDVAPEHFLRTRHLRDYLTMLLTLDQQASNLVAKTSLERIYGVDTRAARKRRQ